MNVLTGELIEIPKEQWELQSRRMILLAPEDYTVIKNAFYDKCISEKCKQSLNLLSGLFEKLDAAVGAVGKW